MSRVAKLVQWLGGLVAEVGLLIAVCAVLSALGLASLFAEHEVWFLVLLPLVVLVFYVLRAHLENYFEAADD